MQNDFQADPREELELDILATLLRRQERLPEVIDSLDPRKFRLPMHVAIAKAIVEAYRLRGAVEDRELFKRLKPQEFELATWLLQQGRVLPVGADLIHFLGSDPDKPAKDPLSMPLEKFPAEVCQWLWHGRIARGQLTLVGGETGSGKSLLACDLAARVTNGRHWPDGTANDEPGRVVLVASPDDVTALVRPRLEAAGADVRRVRVFPIAEKAVAKPGSKPVHGLLDKLPLLEQAIAEVEGCRLVIVDPLHGGDRPATGVAREASAVWEVLADLARRQQVAVVGVVSTEVTSQGRPRPAREAVHTLKMATGNRPAAAWMITRHPHRHDLRLLLPAKNTRGPDGSGLAFAVVAEPAGERLAWQEEPVPRDDTATGSDAARWLCQALADGPLPAKDLLALGEQNGYTPRMLQRAKPAAGVVAVRDGFGPGATWHWVLSAAAVTAKIA